MQLIFQGSKQRCNPKLRWNFMREFVAWVWFSSGIRFFLLLAADSIPLTAMLTCTLIAPIVGILISNKLLSICVSFYIFLHLISEDWNDLDLQRRWKFRWPWPQCESMHYLLERLNQINMCSHKINSWHITHLTVTCQEESYYESKHL